MNDPIANAKAAGRFDGRIATITAEDLGMVAEDEVLELRVAPPAPVPVRPTQRIVPVR